MNPYYYHGYVPQQPELARSFPANSFNHYQRDPRQLDQRVDQLERQNQAQVQEITRINEEIIRLNSELSRINDEILRLNQNDEIHTNRLFRLNQRLRVIEQNLNIPYTGGEDGF
ncbi:hypothetical protein [Halalkalibacter akibai]|uniref:Uncharacterized protein n=1 Tax=Halalkalibacter akibai (strain ATCC 43226 / DSM 21942 / CIP 109018 / JCM 9157 / 1139) TaxID=1236973 RepID=W4QT94_HALA3|nr:hypothetical protein [Halalkalibacter akibai]GAE34853.1 hypothetical protein JCM9157_1933 [Halalkalibacter akibai JCM 9157]